MAVRNLGEKQPAISMQAGNGGSLVLTDGQAKPTVSLTGYGYGPRSGKNAFVRIFGLIGRAVLGNRGMSGHLMLTDESGEAQIRATGADGRIEAKDIKLGEIESLLNTIQKLEARVAELEAREAKAAQADPAAV